MKKTQLKDNHFNSRKYLGKYQDEGFFSYLLVTTTDNDPYKRRFVMFRLYRLSYFQMQSIYIE